MKSFDFRRKYLISVTASVLAVFGLVCVDAHANNKKPPAPAPKAAAPAKPPTPSRPAGGGAGAGASHGPTTGSGGAGHTGPTTTTHTGPTTTTHTGPTTTSPHGPTTTGKPTTTGPTTTKPVGEGTGKGTVAPKTTATGHLAPKGATTVSTPKGAVTKRPNGKISDVHDAKRGMDVHHGLNGSKRVSVERADHSRIVAERGRPGYIERRYSYHGHDYERRAYYWHGHEYNRYYRGYYYGGVYVNVYAPGYYYGPAFYGWAYNPWYAPVSYGWGWAGNPWYAYYGFYFAPYPVYSAPSLWLTDYILSTELAAAYAAQQEAHTDAVAAAAAGQPLLTAEVKQQIADEVKAQIALENAEAQQTAQGQEPDPASSGITRMFRDGKPHVFVAGSALDVVDANGDECALSDGDALLLSTPPAAEATTVNLAVLSSKGSKECARSSTVTVSVADVQEMQNHLRETIDQGLQELQAKQGKGGLPAAPASATAPPVQTAFSQAAPPPETNGDATVNQQLAEADTAEQEVTQFSPIGGVDSAAVPQPATVNSPSPTVNIALGQTEDQVKSALGQPITVVDLGTKKIYKYKDMKITFKAGKVSDVE